MRQGMPVMRTGWQRSGSVLMIFLNQGDRGVPGDIREERLIITLNHEWGHGVQQAKLGLYHYLVGIALPSVMQDPKSDEYFDRPWESGADEFGKVKR